MTFGLAAFGLLKWFRGVAVRGVPMAARGNDSAGGEVEGSSYVHRATEQSARSSADATRVVAAAGAAGATEHGVLPGEPHRKSGSPALVPAQRPPGDATLPAGAPATLQGAAAAAATAAFAGVAGAGDDATERTAAAPPPPLEADNTGAQADWATSHFATVLLGQREQALPGPPQREHSSLSSSDGRLVAPRWHLLQSNDARFARAPRLPSRVFPAPRWLVLKSLVRAARKRACACGAAHA